MLTVNCKPSHLLPPAETWAVLPPAAGSVRLRRGHSPFGSSGEKHESEMEPLTTVSTEYVCTYYSNSSISCAVTLFDHGVAALIPPGPIGPVGPPNALKTGEFVTVQRKTMRHLHRSLLCHSYGVVVDKHVLFILGASDSLVETLEYGAMTRVFNIVLCLGQQQLPRRSIQVFLTSILMTRRKSTTQ